ncbi:MAG: hypothetical protein J5I81_03440 [Nitrococcus mobilis]|nr:hypothetical protein [Nitrococcus mobilis]
MIAIANDIKTLPRAIGLTWGRWATAAALVLLAIPARSAGTGPEKLTHLQMDTVSAGGVAVSAESLATSSGDSGYTSTRSGTFIINTPGADIGLAGGTAAACCGSDTDATVSTDSSGDGAIVAGGGANVANSNPLFSKAIGVEVIVSVNPN